MKTTSSKLKRQQGSIITVIMCTLSIVAITLGSYFMMVQNQSASVSRAQAWSTAIVNGECGVEDAFGLINRTLPGDGSTGWEWTNAVTLVGDNWSVMSNSATSLSRTLTSLNSYSVTVSLPAGTTNPVIDAVGTIKHTVYPWVFTAASGSSQAYTTTLNRKIHVVTTRGWLFPGAIGSKEVIKLSGGSAIDSYDSSNPLYSTGGRYDPLKAKDNATVATDETIVKSIVGTGNITIKGSVVTGPGGASSLGGQASVGDAAWVNSGTVGLETGHSRDDMNMNYLPAQQPTMSWFTPSFSSVGGSNVMILGSSGCGYQTPSLNMSSSDTILITGSNVVLYVPGTAKMSSSAAIILVPGASAKIYFGGDTDLEGQGVVNPGVPNNLQIYGLPTCTSFKYAGQSAFTGTIYAPQADVTLGGGGGFFGALIANSFTSSGGGGFHYDEALGKGGPLGPFLAQSWQEVAYP